MLFEQIIAKVDKAIEELQKTLNQWITDNEILTDSKGELIAVRETRPADVAFANKLRKLLQAKDFSGICRLEHDPLRQDIFQFNIQWQSFRNLISNIQKAHRDKLCELALADAQNAWKILCDPKLFLLLNDSSITDSSSIAARIFSRYKNDTSIDDDIKYKFYGRMLVAISGGLMGLNAEDVLNAIPVDRIYQSFEDFKKRLSPIMLAKLVLNIHKRNIILKQGIKEEKQEEKKSDVLEEKKTEQPNPAESINTLSLVEEAFAWVVKHATELSKEQLMEFIMEFALCSATLAQQVLEHKDLDALLTPIQRQKIFTAHPEIISSLQNMYSYSLEKQKTDFIQMMQSLWRDIDVKLKEYAGSRNLKFKDENGKKTVGVKYSLFSWLPNSASDNRIKFMQLVYDNKDNFYKLWQLFATNRYDTIKGVESDGDEKNGKRLSRDCISIKNTLARNKAFYQLVIYIAALADPKKAREILADPNQYWVLDPTHILAVGRQHQRDEGVIKALIEHHAAYLPPKDLLVFINSTRFVEDCIKKFHEIIQDKNDPLWKDILAGSTIEKVNEDQRDRGWVSYDATQRVQKLCEKIKKDEKDRMWKYILQDFNIEEFQKTVMDLATFEQNRALRQALSKDGALEECLTSQQCLALVKKYPDMSSMVKVVDAYLIFYNIPEKIEQSFNEAEERQKRLGKLLNDERPSRDRLYGLSKKDDQTYNGVMTSAGVYCKAYEEYRFQVYIYALSDAYNMGEVLRNSEIRQFVWNEDIIDFVKRHKKDPKNLNFLIECLEVCGPLRAIKFSCDMLEQLQDCKINNEQLIKICSACESISTKTYKNNNAARDLLKTAFYNFLVANNVPDKDRGKKYIELCGTEKYSGFYRLINREDYQKLDTVNKPVDTSRLAVLPRASISSPP